MTGTNHNNKYRISSFGWTWPGQESDECHAVYKGITLIALCPDKGVAERVILNEEQKDQKKIRNDVDAMLHDVDYARLNGRGKNVFHVNKENP